MMSNNKNITVAKAGANRDEDFFSSKPTGFIHLSLFLFAIWIFHKVFSSKHFRIKTPAFEIERTAPEKPVKKEKETEKKVKNVSRRKKQ